MALADPTASGFDTFLKVWAIVGPLLAAVASALWSRHIQIGDREFERTRDIERGEREQTLKRQEHTDTIQKEKYSEAKSGLADFMASSHEYVRKQSDYLTNPLPERYQAATAANDKFVYSCQIVTLLGSDAVASAAINLWNATLAIPKSYNVAQTPDYEDKLRVYRNSRAVFNETARAYLAEFETGTHNPQLNRTRADDARAG
jgi:hypothetical protein